MGIIFDKPLIGVVMCQTHHHGHPVQSVHNKYLDAVVTAGGVPLALPHQLMAAPHLSENAMAALDGILLTGSPSNLEPWLYGEAGEEPDADGRGCVPAHGAALLGTSVAGSHHEDDRAHGQVRTRWFGSSELALLIARVTRMSGSVTR